MESTCSPSSLQQPCFICWKKVDVASNRNKNREQFFAYICRYIKISYTEESPNICQECYPILETFSEIFKEWTSLQNKLNEKIHQITKLMNAEMNQRGNAEFDGVVGIQQKTTTRKSSEFRNKFIVCANAVSSSKLTTSGPDANDSPMTTTYRSNHDHDNETRVNPEPQPRPVNKTTRQKPISDKSVECRFCGKRLANLSSRWHHENIHRGVKLHFCNVCNRQFSQKTSLLSHQLVHSGDKPFKCEICGTGFSSARNCRLHQERSHSEGEVLKLESTRRSPQMKTYGKSRKTPQYKMTYGLPPSEQVLVTTKSEPVDNFLDESVNLNNAYESDVAMDNRRWSLHQQQQQTPGDIAGEIKFEVDPLTLRFR